MVDRWLWLCCLSWIRRWRYDGVDVLRILNVCVVVADKGTSDPQPGRLGYARQTALPRHSDPRLGNRLLRPTALRQRGVTKVSLFIFTKHLQLFYLCALTLLVGWQEVHPACKKLEWWGAGMVICLEQGADLHMTQLMPLPLTVSYFSKIQIGSTYLVLAHPCSPGQRAIKQVCVYVSCVISVVVCAD